MTNAETQLAALFTNFEPAIARLGKALRKKLRARLPGFFEVVYHYERQGSLVLAYSPTERGYDAVCSLGLYPEQVKLFFARGPLLAGADPQRLLKGSGKVVRYVEMAKAGELDRPEIEALMVAALDLAKACPVAGTEGAIVLKVEEQAQRASRAKRAPRAASPGRGRTPRR